MRRGRVASPNEHLFDTRFDGGEFVVIADMPGTDVAELTVGIDPRTTQLVIGRGDTVLERVDAPWNAVEITRAWFNNGILEVRLRTASP